MRLTDAVIAGVPRVPIVLFADADGVVLPPWLVILLAVAAPTGPLYLAVKGLAWVWRQWRGDVVEDEAAHEKKEQRQETAVVKVLRDQIDDVRKRAAADREECEEQISGLRKDVSTLTDRATRSEVNNANLSDWLIYFQSMIDAYGPPEVKEKLKRFYPMPEPPGGKPS